MSLFKRNKSKSVLISPRVDFLEGAQRFEKGKVYRVEIGLARYFERNGWLEGSLADPPAAVRLDVDDSTLGVRGGM